MGCETSVCAEYFSGGQDTSWSQEAGSACTPGLCTYKKLWDLGLCQIYSFLGHGASWSQEAGSARTHGLCKYQNYGTLVRAEFLLRGAGYELIPRGRISSYPWVVHIQKIMRPWFVSNLLLLGAGYELIPGGRINSYPWVVRIQKLWDLVCSGYFTGGQGTS